MKANHGKATVKDGLIAAGITGAAFVVLVASLESPAVDWRSFAVLTFASALTAVVLAAVSLRGPRGLAFVWLLLLVYWIYMALGVGASRMPATVNGSRILGIGVHVPGGFVSWSLLALPVYGATALILRRANRLQLERAVIIIAWLVLCLLARLLASEPADLSGLWYSNRIWPALMLIFGIPLPLALSAWLVRSSWRN